MQDEFQTLDMGEAAALFALDFDLIRLEMTKHERQRSFIFSAMSADTEYPTASKVAEDYRRKRLAVDAYTFFIAIKEIKNRLYDSLCQMENSKK